MDLITAPNVVKKKNMGPFFNELIKNKVLYLMLVPGFILVFIFSYLPMPGIVIAFKNFKFHGNIIESISKSEWVGFDNFMYLFKSPNAFVITRNTICYNLVFIFGGLMLSVALAIALNELGKDWKAKFYQTFFMLPYFFSWVIVAFFVYGFLSMDHGVINYKILEPLGMEPIMWYNEPKYWPFILTIANFWKNTGFGAVVYLAAISNISQEYYNAAEIDGASRFKQIRYITLPMLTPIMIILTILAIGKIFNADFGLFYNVGMTQYNGILHTTTDVIDTYVYRILANADFQSSAAASLYQSSVGFVLVLLTNLAVKKIEPEYALF